MTEELPWLASLPKDWERCMDRNTELQRLAEADRHIVEAERAVSHQTMELEQLRADGHDTALAEKTLESFQRALGAMQEHRKIIIRTIEAIDAGLI
jgi:hexokinase